MNRSIKCTDCGKKLNNENDPCPACGSTNKTISMELSENLRGSIHEQLSGKVKKDGTKRPTKEFIYGDDRRVSNGTWVDKTRIINREDNEYTEIIKDKKTNQTIHKCNESLTDHFNHGSAKQKSKKDTKH